MMNFPRVSIITPSYNQGNFLEETIRSVVDQDYPNLEYIVIDGGSTDNSIEIIKKYQNRIAFWISEPDNGQSHAFNKGLQKATGELIGWINSDDVYYPGSIVQASQFFLKNPDTDVVFSDYTFIDHKSRVIRTRKEIPYDYKTYLWTKGCYHANCAGFFRRTCFEKFGGLREDLGFGMDYELYLRFGKNNCKFSHTNQIWGGYRLHSMSKTVLSSDSQIRDNDFVFSLYAGDNNNSNLLRSTLTSFYRGRRLLKKLIAGCYF
jgi:glycosyltransferase involved in cell wall biosynthesis